jgi:hypothetical protein
LRRAIERALPDLEHEAAACESLASLSMMLADHDAARAWIQRGLQLQPLSSSLAKLAAEFAGAHCVEHDVRDVLATIGDVSRSPQSPSLERAA